MMKNYKELAEIVAKEFNYSIQENEVKPMKAGMTNDSFLCRIKGKDYVIRLNGLGTQELIDRQQEALVYDLLKKSNLNLADEIVSINTQKGYKISKFMVGARNCNGRSPADLKLVMAKLKEFHNSKLRCTKEFDLLVEIEHYESLLPIQDEKKNELKKRLVRLYDVAKNLITEKVLCHIDANADNFLILPGDEVRLIDWEYAAMADPDLDLAMFGLYSMYSQEELDT